MSGSLFLVIAAGLGSYLLGAIPFSYLIPRIFLGTDVRRHGSGNPGASNVSRVCGKSYGAAALALDVGKGMLAAYLVYRLGAPAPLGFLAVLGHVFNPFFGFSGGKGVATSLGVLLYTSPLSALVFVAIWVAVILIWRMAGLSSLAAITTVPISIYFLDGISPLLWAATSLALLIYLTHRGNIVRIYRGEEREM